MADIGSSSGSGHGPSFSGLFLTYLIIATFLSIFFLLYFNRAFASVVSWAIRTWTWHLYGIYIDVQAVQISLLGGRVFFVGLRYHGNNETILIQNGHITWSYWLRRVREVDISRDGDGKDGPAGNHSAPSPMSPGEKSEKSEKSSRLPCRVIVTLAGLEWFVYNRSAAYDSILAGLTEDPDREQPPVDGPAQESEGHQRLRKRHSRRADGSNGSLHEKSASHGAAKKGTSKKGTSQSRGSSKSRDASEERKATVSPKKEDLPAMLQLFPIHIDCDRAALVMGNENTRAVLVVKAKTLSGEVNASATETVDPYRQVFKIKFEEPVIEMRENEDFKEDQVSRARREKQIAKDTGPQPRRSFLRRQRRMWHDYLRNLVPSWKGSVESLSSDHRSPPGTAAAHVPGSSHWQGLSRYLDQEGDEKTRWSSTEYAALNPILESPRASLTIYWDAVTKVASIDQPGEKNVPGKSNNINGDEPPAWGIDVSVHGGSLNYGPWADRQRAELQRTFFPGLCKDAKPAEKLPAGAYRVATQFKLYVELTEEVTLRVPTREQSKNWRFKGKDTGADPRRSARDRRKARNRLKKADPAATTAHQRPYGWLDFKIAANATVSYSMDMVASSTGFSSLLDLDLPKVEISSSVNQQILWRSGSQRISCDLSTPLKWNGLRQWYFRIVSHDLKLFLLREHVFLLIDLVDDWTSGPPVEYLVFTPFKYHIELQFRNLRLYLNVNDANIINDPTSFDDNTFIIISSPLLKSATCIPMDRFRPSKNAIPFDVRADTAIIDLHVPPWNTQAAFVSSKEVGQLENLVVDGKYHYNATTSPANTDTLVLDVVGQSPVANLYGFVIRYFLKLKDNYFGEDVHFKTLEEYQESQELKERDPEADLANRPPPKKSNDLDVILSVRADDPKVLLPANLYSSVRHTQLDAACLSVDLRFTNYYMDLDMVLSPLSLSLGTGGDDGEDTPTSVSPSTQLFVDGIHIYGNRLFGLPPTEPTYLCNWDVSVGDVTGECTTDFLTALASGGKAFGFAFDDEENALIPYSSIVMYDVTFLRVFVESVQIWLHLEEAAFLLSSGNIQVKYNDWARSHYSKRADILVPDLQVSCVNSDSAMRHKSRSQVPVETDAFVKTTISLAIISRKFDFSKERRLQQELVRQQDQRTHRAQFLLLPGLLDDLVPDRVDPPAQPVPPMPEPITSRDVEVDTKSLSSSNSSRIAPKKLRRQASFLSVSSSSQSSVVRTQSSLRSSLKPKHPSGLQPLMPIDPPQMSQNHPGLSPVHRREVSSSTRHSAFYSAVGDYADRRDPGHNTVAFSSQYFAPYFPFENVKPDTREATMQSVEEDEDAAEPHTAGFDLEDINPEMLSEDCVYSSTLLQFPQGVTAFFNPVSARHVAALISALQPSHPEDVLDSIQIGTMADVLAMQKNEKMKGHVQDFVVRVPRANFRFINSSSLDSPDPPQEEQDQYDITVSKAAFITRSQSRWQDSFKPETKESHHSFQFRLGSAELSASERIIDMEEPQAAFVAQIDDVLVSMGSKDLTYLDADIGGMRGKLSSEKIQYLASLIHRTGILASDLGSIFPETLSREDRIRRYVICRLIDGGQGVADPTFLVRPSAVLRSASRHLRTYDSWKLAARLRQMWSRMKPDAKEQLRLDCLRQDIQTPRDARQQVAAAFERWRGWDLDDINRSVLLDNIFGQLKPSKDATPEPVVPFMAVVRVREAQLAIDPGPKQNEIVFLDLTARFENNSPGADKSETGADPMATPLDILNIYCADTTVSLNWELCELVDDILRLYQRMQTSASRPVSESERKPKTVARSARTLHVVLAVARGSIVLDTINLNARSMSSDLKASLLLRNGGTGITDANFILNCDAISSRVKSHSQLLSTFQLRGPSVFIAHEIQATQNTNTHTIKATASSHEMSLAVKQDPLVLMETLDLLVKDEAAQLYRLKHQLPSSPATQTTQSVNIVDQLSAFRVNVAVFLNQYTISIPLLRSLTYNITGVVSRASMAANFGKEIIFDFDVKENSHDMQISVNNTPRSISILQIPPTNGRITSHTGQSEHLLTVFSSLELVQLDASAVYSLLSALNRPEISNTVTDIQQQAKIIKSHVAEIFGDGTGEPSTTEPALSEHSLPLVYSVHSTFAGLEIFGDSPLKSETAPIAHLSFSLKSIHLELANRVDGGPILAYPEVHINLCQISFEIQKGREGLMRSCGNMGFGALITATSKLGEDGSEDRSFNVKSDGFDIQLSPETVSTVVDVLGYMGDRIKDLDTSRELEYLRRLRQSKPRIAINDKEEEEEEEADIIDSFLSSVTYFFEIRNIQISWLCGTRQEEEPTPGIDDLVLSLARIEFGTRTKNSARLTIENLQVEMVPPSQDKRMRSLNSALLPEVIFNVAYLSTQHSRRFAFQAVGKSLDLRLTSGFIVPAAKLKDSISLSIKNVQKASQHWHPISAPVVTPAPTAEKAAESQPRQRSIFGKKRLESFLVDADFAGAVVYITGKKVTDETSLASVVARENRPSGPGGKYGQFNADESGSSTVLRSPGLAWKMEYSDNGRDDPTLYAEVKIDASSNVLYPSVVPLVIDMTSAIKEVVSSSTSKPAQQQPSETETETPAKPKPKQEESNILTADPSAVLGRVKLNLGLRICKQQFALSCQPIARVAATASFEDVYFTMNTVRSTEQGNFFAISGAFTQLQASVQHVYSRESTGSFDVDSIVLSLMNSKHVSGTSGVSAILKVSPMKIAVNAKQLQDFLLFREIWMPGEIKPTTSTAPVAKLVTETSQGHLVQRYQQVAATAAFPWTATISITALDISVDLGQALGKSVFSIADFWVSSKKTSDWEQNLCLGFQRIGVDSTGRMSGFVALQDFRLRTSIEWPEREQALNETPLIQASVSFSQLRIKAAFDYQAFLVADITSMDFLMYNVRRSLQGTGDRLVASFDGDAVQVFGTTTSAAQSVALYQAFQKLVQERRANFEASLKEIERFLRRKSSIAPEAVNKLVLAEAAAAAAKDEPPSKSPISLDTDVVVTLKAVNLGVFPSTFSDHQVFKMEALDAQARFAANIEGGRVHSSLGLTLGQLRIGLAGVRQLEAPKTLSELSVEDVVQSATGSRGGTILKVPRVQAGMQTWQSPESKQIEYIFKSAFEGKVEVGWNYSRISYIRGMWANHTKTLAQTYGKELPLTGIKVTGVPEGGGEGGEGGEGQGEGGQTKITAEVHVPQSKYEYVPLEPPVIETPQLRDMGEATPPLEWIGLHRDRLPNLTHQIVIVALLELAGEVEDAYSQILGST